MSEKTVIETIETQAHRIIIEGDGIIRVYSKPSHITLADVKTLLDKLGEIRTTDSGLIVLMDPTEENSMTIEARNYIIRNMKTQLACLVIISRKKFVRTIFSIVSSVKNIGVNMKMAKSEKEGENWIFNEYFSQVKE